MNAVVHAEVCESPLCRQDIKQGRNRDPSVTNKVRSEPQLQEVNSSQGERLVKEIVQEDSMAEPAPTGMNLECSRNEWKPLCPEPRDQEGGWRR